MATSTETSSTMTPRSASESVSNVTCAADAIPASVLPQPGCARNVLVRRGGGVNALRVLRIAVPRAAVLPAAGACEAERPLVADGPAVVQCFAEADVVLSGASRSVATHTLAAARRGWTRCLRYP